MNPSRSFFRVAVTLVSCVFASALQLEAQTLQLIQGPYLSVDTHSKSRGETVGNSNLGATFSATAAATRRAAGFISPYSPLLGGGGSVRYFQASAGVSATLDVRLFGRSAQAAQASYDLQCRDAEWDEYWDAAAGKWLARNYRVVNFAGASRRLRVAGMDIELPGSATETVFDVQRSLTLFSVSSPTFPLGPASIRVNCSAMVTAGYWAAITPGLPLTGGSGLALRGTAYAEVRGSANLSASMPLVSSGLSQDIRVGGLTNRVDVTTTEVKNWFGTTPLRLMVSAWIKVGYSFATRTFRRTLYDETPYVGWGEVLNF